MEFLHRMVNAGGNRGRLPVIYLMSPTFGTALPSKRRILEVRVDPQAQLKQFQ